MPGIRPSAGNAATREITVAHSPDSDDAFMFYALATNKVRVPGLRFTHTLCDIETLNRKGAGRRVRRHRDLVPCLSLHSGSLCFAAQRWQRGRRIRPDDRGAPCFHRERNEEQEDCRSGKARPRPIWRCKLFAPGIETEVVPFDQIIPQVLEGKYEAGLIIHEGQLTYVEGGLASHRGSWANGG